MLALARKIVNGEEEYLVDDGWQVPEPEPVAFDAGRGGTAPEEPVTDIRPFRGLPGWRRRSPVRGPPSSAPPPPPLVPAPRGHVPFSRVALMVMSKDFGVAVKPTMFWPPEPATVTATACAVSNNDAPSTWSSIRLQNKCLVYLTYCLFDFAISSEPPEAKANRGLRLC